MTIHKKGQAHWEGDIKRGKGTVSTESGVLNQQPYGFNTRFEGEKGTNPEELIGAAHAACFSMALSLMLGEAGFTPTSIDTTADVSLDKVDAGFAITKIALKSEVAVPGIDASTFDGISICVIQVSFAACFPAYCRLLLTAVCTAIISRRYSSVTTARKNSGTVAAASTVTLPFLLLRNNFSNRVEADKDTLSDTE